jgi:hypothetical protein
MSLYVMQPYIDSNQDRVFLPQTHKRSSSDDDGDDDEIRRGIFNLVELGYYCNKTRDY